MVLGISSIDPLQIAPYVELFFYGIYTPLFYGTLYVLGKKRKTATIICLLLATVVMYTIASVHVIVDVVFQLVATNPSDLDAQACVDFYEGTAVPRPSRELLLYSSSGLSAVIRYIPTVNFLIGDGIVVWRAWVIWGQSFRVIFVPIISLLATLGIVIVENATAFLFMSELGLALHAAAVSLTLFTNIVVTCMIGYRAWAHHRSMSLYKIRVGHDSTQTVLLLLLESGAMYCGIWVVYLILIFTCGEYSRTTENVGFLIFDTIVPQLIGFYPTLIIVLCALQQSYSDIILSSHADSLPTLAIPPSNAGRTSGRIYTPISQRPNPPPTLSLSIPTSPLLNEAQSW